MRVELGFYEAEPRVAAVPGRAWDRSNRRPVRMAAPIV